MPVDNVRSRQVSPGRFCLVTGATGYIGARLVPELLAAGHRVRVLARTPEKLRDQPWIGQVQVVKGDVGDSASLREAFVDIDVAFYLVHALGTGESFAQVDRKLARTFGETARNAHLSRIVYLGGLTPEDEELSPHLRSRQEVGDVLLGCGVPTAVLRAAIILGSGSASFEMLRYLTQRLPVMVTPRWVTNKVQPIAIRDVLRYLVGCVDLPPEVNRAFDIGGPDVLTYAQMMQGFAQVAQLPRRRIVPLPVLTPRLSSHWVGVVTPVPSSIARPLVESLRNTVVCDEHDIAAYVPDPPGGLVGFRSAVELALSKIKEQQVPSSWTSAATFGAPSEPLPSDPTWAGGDLYVDERERAVDAPPDALWRVIEGIGGERGWYSFALAWRVRGLLDRASGGPGLRRGRRNPDDLYVGDALDFWRVEEVVEGSLLRLRAEMRLPGLAWLELSIREDERPDGTKQTVYVQRATFHPHGLAGQAYWWSISPFHGVVFGDMARNIAHAAELGAATDSGDGATAATVS